MRAPRLTLALPVILAIAACSNDGPATPTRACRRWPLRYSTGGATFTCDPSPSLPSCSAFPINIKVTWEYRSQADFVHEADVPNRVLALRQSTVGCGTFAVTGCRQEDVRYEYDSQGRLARRVRTWSHTLGGGGTFDEVTYSGWDRRGRPTQGQKQAEGQVSPLRIDYDDAQRTARASDGEVVQQDVFGNALSEVVVRGGSTSETIYSIQSYQDVCETAP
jgi:hypothetical protein